MLQFGIISLFPAMFDGLQFGVTGRAIQQGLIKLSLWNPRDWAINEYGQVDDRPFGGGPGMVMRYEPLKGAINAAKKALPRDLKTIVLSPQGKKITQEDLNKVASNNQSLLFVAGRYEGIDERILTHHVDEAWSLGDFVLSGGEFAAMAFIDAITRLVPGSLGNKNSAQEDSFMNGLLDYPHYTRPAEIDNYVVPAVLLNGNHAEISRWRRKQSLGKTWLYRPELIDKLDLSKTDELLLNEFIQELQENS